MGRVFYSLLFFLTWSFACSVQGVLNFGKGEQGLASKVPESFRPPGGILPPLTPELIELLVDNQTANDLEACGQIAAAIQLWQKCADRGCTTSMAILGDIHYHGRPGQSKDFKKAWQWFRRCVDHGPSELSKAVGTPDVSRIEAMRILGSMYCDGLGVDQNLDEAEKLLKAAAEAKCPMAMGSYASFLLEFRNTPQHKQESFKWYKLSAEAGSSVGMLNLGLRYADGHGTEKNLDLAEKWIRKSLDAGQGSAAVELAEFLYITGRGSKQERIRLLRQGTQNSSPMKTGHALCMLADMLLADAEDERAMIKAESKQLGAGTNTPEPLTAKEKMALEAMKDAEKAFGDVGAFFFNQSVA
jgi:TPR repeat protein